jgi:hypothetical protein
MSQLAGCAGISQLISSDYCKEFYKKLKGHLCIATLGQTYARGPL